MAVPNFPIDEAYLIGSWLESFFWGKPPRWNYRLPSVNQLTYASGLYTLLFAMSMRTIYKKRKEGINKFTTFCLVLLWV